MALTRSFRDTVLERAKHDDEFRVSLFLEAIDLLLEGEVEVSKKHLLNYIHASISMDDLAKMMRKKKTSIHRMLGPNGNPGVKSLFSIIKVLQDHERIRLTTAKDSL